MTLCSKVVKSAPKTQLQSHGWDSCRLGSMTLSSIEERRGVDARSNRVIAELAVAQGSMRKVTRLIDDRINLVLALLLSNRLEAT